MRALLRLLLLTTAAYAQEFRAVISGDVNDASGASIPGVRVTAQSVDRKVEYAAVTNESGRYVTLSCRRVRMRSGLRKTTFGRYSGKGFN